MTNAGLVWTLMMEGREVGERIVVVCNQKTSCKLTDGIPKVLWRGIWVNFRARLVIVHGNLNSEGYVRKIMRDDVLPFKVAYPSVMAFQLDNARGHNSRF